MVMFSAFLLNEWMNGWIQSGGHPNEKSNLKYFALFRGEVYTEWHSSNNNNNSNIHGPREHKIGGVILNYMAICFISFEIFFIFFLSFHFVKWNCIWVFFVAKVSKLTYSLKEYHFIQVKNQPKWNDKQRTYRNEFVINVKVCVCCACMCP